jgi:putative membrane protein
MHISIKVRITHASKRGRSEKLFTGCPCQFVYHLFFNAGWRSLWNPDFYRANMQSGTRPFFRFLGSWAINTLAVLVAYYIVPGIHFGRWSDLLIASALLGISNAFIRPILMFFALPLLIFTLGLFTFVINALLLYGVGWLMGLWGLQFTVDTFWSAFLGALIISIVSVMLNILTGTGSTRITLSRRQPPPKKSDDDGPVIDV